MSDSSSSSGERMFIGIPVSNRGQLPPTVLRPGTDGGGGSKLRFELAAPTLSRPPLFSVLDGVSAWNPQMCSVVPLGYPVASGAAGFHIGRSPVAVTADFQASDDGPENFATSSEVEGGVGIDLHLRLAPP
nr:zinc finger protein 6-like [Ipomoea batatas]